jgi:hypothetical protein
MQANSSTLAELTANVRQMMNGPGYGLVPPATSGATHVDVHHHHHYAAKCGLPPPRGRTNGESAACPAPAPVPAQLPVRRRQREETPTPDGRPPKALRYSADGLEITGQRERTPFEEDEDEAPVKEEPIG